MSEPVVQDPALDAAVKLHQAGKIDRAAEAYRQILEQHPDDANALHLLGVTELQSGSFDQAVALISRAIVLQPNTGLYHANLAAALRAVRRIDDAIAEAEKAILLDPKLAAQGYHIAALAFMDADQPGDAVDCWNKALEHNADFAEAHLSLAILMDGLGRYYETLTQRQRAERLCREAVERQPESAPARVMLGRCLELAGNLDAAVKEYRVATKLLPHDATVFQTLGHALKGQGLTEEAVTCLRFAVRMNPRLAEARVTLGELLRSQRRPAEAAEEFRAAVAILPRHPRASSHLAAALAELGEVEQAVQLARDAVADHPNSAANRSLLLRTLQLDARVTPRELFQQHLEWDNWHSSVFRNELGPHDKIAKDPERPLRIGIVSPLLRRHAVAKFVLPLLEQIDRKLFAVICYHDSPTADPVTKQIQQRASEWRNVAPHTDAQFALLVREDRIDVLIDLTGHGEGNRMLTFAQKPAPVQVTMSPYGFTTGPSAIDYRVSDEVATPPGELDSLHAETLVRLPRPAVCYRPWEPIPSRIEARAENEPVTFGCVSDLAKVSTQTLDAWARLMANMPDARLLVMSSTPDLDLARACLTRRGIPSFRLGVVPPLEGEQYLNLFNQMDIVLDTFSCGGLGAAGDALFMGKPVVTLTGMMPASRRAAVFLSHVDLADLIASSPQQYVDTAAGLAADRTRLARLAATLRETFLHSPLCDPRGCASALEGFLRDAWRRYCGRT